jgi:hypothetical protein
MASQDQEVLKEVWEGKLPICFRLSDDECNSAEPEELYVGVFFQTVNPQMFNYFYKNRLVLSITITFLNLRQLITQS